jgi:hypothetical protein
MKIVTMQKFSNGVARLPEGDRALLRRAVDDVVANPDGFSHPHLHPWQECFERRTKFGYRIVYTMRCGHCGKSGLKSQHRKCEAHDDDAVVLVDFYVAM